MIVAASNIKNGEPKLWKYFEETVFSTLPGRYMVAGGAIVDFYINRVPKDFDLFFETQADFEEVRATLLSQGFTESDCGVDSVFTKDCWGSYF